MSSHPDHDARLEENVRPESWTNPKPNGRYNLVVIGGGTAGLVTAAIAAGLGAKVALVERNRLGGDCLNVGCVPSKALIRTSRAAAETRRAPEFGIRGAENCSVDFPAVMERMRRLRADISRHDSAERFRSLGVDVYFGQAEFAGPDAIRIDDQELKFKRAVIAAGTSPRVPDIPGLGDAGSLTNESIFSLTELPRRIAVIGAGPVGAELAQAFARFGSEVFLFDRAHHVLPKEDADAAALVENAMQQDGVHLVLEAHVRRVERPDDGAKAVFYETDRGADSVVVDAVLVAAGRTPNVNGMALEAAGIEFDPQRGVQVDDRLQTTNPAVFAAGDIAMKHKFTHAADAAARLVVRNALFFGRARASDLIIPWCTFTEPEVAHIGRYEDDARRDGIDVVTFRRDFGEVDRAVLDGETNGFVKVHAARGSDRILGATIVARDAGAMISEIAVAMAGKIGLKRLGSVIHPYPTQSEAIRQTGDDFTRTRFTPRLARLTARWLAWRRR